MNPHKSLIPFATLGGFTKKSQSKFKIYIQQKSLSSCHTKALAEALPSLRPCSSMSAGGRQPGSSGPTAPPLTPASGRSCLEGWLALSQPERPPAAGSTLREKREHMREEIEKIKKREGEERRVPLARIFPAFALAKSQQPNQRGWLPPKATAKNILCVVQT
jgi:hypothetical protein